VGELIVGPPFQKLMSVDSVLGVRYGIETGVPAAFAFVSSGWPAGLDFGVVVSPARSVITTSDGTEPETEGLRNPPKDSARLTGM
jgi:hypothetical protein